MNERHFVFGYGSLVADLSAGRVARLSGLRRTWGVAMDNTLDVPGYKSYRLCADGSRPAVFVAFVDLEDDVARAVTGVCAPVDEHELRALDDRERNYDRVDVTHAVQDAPGRVWTYRGSAAGQARLRAGLADGRAVVSREYFEAVLAGVAAIAPDEVADLERSPARAGLALLDLERVEVRRPGGP